MSEVTRPGLECSDTSRFLDAAGYGGKRATLANLWVAPAFNDAKKLDQDRYRQGLPHIFDDQ